MKRLRAGEKEGEKEREVTSLSAPKNPGGRPSDFKPEFCETAYNYCLLGATDSKLADFFDVCETTINNWKKDYPEFLASIKKGKESADAEAAASLFSRVKGYNCKETKFFLHEGAPVTVDIEKHYPPDPVSCIFWLKNRQPGQWRDKQIIEATGDLSITVNIIDSFKEGDDSNSSTS